MAGDVPVYESQLGPGQGNFTPIEGVHPPHYDAGAIGKDISQFGTAVEKFAHARAITLDITARTDVITALAGLREKYEADPDYINAQSKFRDDAQKIIAEKTAGLPADRAAVSREFMTSHMLTAERHVHSMALFREQKAVFAGLDTGEKSELAASLEAGSPIERGAAAARFANTVDQAVQGGWITREEAQQRKLRFATALDLGDARAAIARNPVAARAALEHKDLFPTLTDPERHTWSSRAQTAAIADETRVMETPVAEGYARAAAGTLDARWLADNRDALPDSAARDLETTLARPPAMRSDPNALWRLYDAANSQPDTAHVAATRALGAGEITLAHAKALDQAASVAAAASPEARAVRASVIARLKPSALQDPVEGVGQLGGVAAFDQWLAQNPKASADQAAGQADTVVTASLARAAANERGLLELPKFSIMPRQKLDAAGITDAADRLRAAIRGGLVDDSEVVAEVALMRRWQDLMTREQGTKP